MTRLNLAYNGLQDEGTIALTESEFVRNLRFLDLSGNSVERDGVIALASCTAPDPADPSGSDGQLGRRRGRRRPGPLRDAARSGDARAARQPHPQGRRPRPGQLPLFGRIDPRALDLTAERLNPRLPGRYDDRPSSQCERPPRPLAFAPMSVWSPHAPPSPHPPPRPDLAHLRLRTRRSGRALFAGRGHGPGPDRGHASGPSSPTCAPSDRARHARWWTEPDMRPPTSKRTWASRDRCRHGPRAARDPASPLGRHPGRPL